MAVGGGGYNMATVPRMWTAACLTLGRVDFDDRVPEALAEPWGMPTYFDPDSEVKGIGREYADGVLDWLSQNLHPVVGKS